MRKLLVVAVAMLALTVVSCGKSSNTNVGVNYTTTSQDKWNTMTIETHWVSPTEIDSVCKGFGTHDGGDGADYNGCARSKPGNIHICEVYTVRPSSFDDTDRLQVFGHEAWHCFGATHE